MDATKSWLVPSLAIVGIVVIEAIAIAHGLNGVMLAATIAAVAGLGGFEVGRRSK